ncbi:MAG: acyl-CoA desaturase [Oscillatoriales cyanobacterium RM1_1_9]|nr:acyl-CoA desaturase [Oscillatoriales cyanobacterium SM2_3_0]NJO46992.1 acyl-CoA desaturase [Oscillatoriales cyanobacterium RM2_1_1]NJO71470.1 acyl-CoA desaturase [Oscillatoriales cyanobacterium RM1_1_9]
MHQLITQSDSAVSVTPVNQAPLKLHWVTLLFIVAIHGLALLAPSCFSVSALVVALLFHWLCGSIGICLGYHRLLSHRSFQVPKWLEYIVVTLGALALQGGPIFWVAGHRQHHAHTEDHLKDPYSANRGFWWSHMLWLFYQSPQFFNYENYKGFAPDVNRDPYYRWLNQYHLLPQLLLGLLLYGLGGWSFVIYGIFLRSVLLWHSTWLINSASHIWGYRTFAADDNARNLWWAALLTYGEGWHNNHHTYPRVAKAGRQWWEIDMTWWVIRGLEQLGLAQKVVRPR